jgi:orotate phosphoribosyltransferase
MNLFQRGHFPLHSGRLSWFKIECENLTDEDLATFCDMIHRTFGKFKMAIGIPTGGSLFAEIFNDQYCDPKSNKFLILDDVYTTGGSMRDIVKDLKSGTYQGVVIFARRPVVESWITPIFEMREIWRLETNT